ncbi:hypothetical protein [Thauera aromatica]|uniref:DUF4376 domain-containing protein n=1 Tax=Thauera aromatica K172 TaxID=44139 RepID=A0A2R4BP48_THAAR|nr:hypothetical protein [Thauera aromatica]AVR89004.1 hypothetical protein Tharo_2101 [Thauera aromatica K172]
MLQHFFFYEPSGKVVGTGACMAKDIDLQVREGAALALGVADRELHYYDQGRGLIVEKPPRPSQFHIWDWPTKSWLPDLDRARTSRQAEVGAELARRDLAPIAYAGAAFDADTQARENISGTLGRLLRGDGLPGGWIGWRDRANAMHWATDDAATVQAHLAALSRAIEDRKQALLVAAWQHKAAIAALTDISAVLAHDLAAGWPA